MTDHSLSRVAKAITTGLWIDHEIRVCTYDIDFAGHVSNIVYLRWLEEMRLLLFDKYFPLKTFLDQGKTPVIASTYIEYKRPVRLFDKPCGVMWMSEVGKAKIIIEAEFYVADNITTIAKHTGVFVELATGRPIRVPDICVKLYREAQEMVPAER
jgi:acyl-CoA thioester hydrolase